MRGALTYRRIMSQFIKEPLGRSPLALQQFVRIRTICFVSLGTRCWFKSSASQNGLSTILSAAALPNATRICVRRNFTLSIVTDYLVKVMAIKIHIAIKPGHFGALHHISMHTGQPSLIKSWSETKGFVFRGNHVLLKSTWPFIASISFCLPDIDRLKTSAIQSHSSA